MLRRKRSNLPLTPVEYPVGSFIRTEAGYFYISSNTKRMRFISERSLHSWSPPRVIVTSEAAVEKYTILSKMKFRSGSLIHNLEDGKIYLIQGKLRRPLASAFTLEKLGAKLSDVISVSMDEINLHEMGEEYK